MQTPEGILGPPQLVQIAVRNSVKQPERVTGVPSTTGVNLLAHLVTAIAHQVGS